MKNFWLVLAVAALSTASVGSVAEASFVMNNTGGYLPPAAAPGHNSIDSNWTVSGPSGGPATYVKSTGFPVGGGNWLQDAASPSRWIAPTTGASHATGQYDFTTTFDLTDFIPSTASFAGRWMADNTLLGVFLNGNSLGISKASDSFSSWNAFAPVTSFFVAGVNTLTFSVVNAVGATQNPTGLRVEFTDIMAEEDLGGGGVVIPEPAAVVSWLIGSVCVLGMIGMRRRRAGEFAVAGV